MGGAIQADFAYKKKCILCLVGFKICCNVLGLLVLILGMAAIGGGDGDNKAVWIIVLAVTFIVVVIDTVLAVMFYNAVKEYDVPRMMLLIKIGIAAFIISQLIALIQNIADDENGNVMRWFVNFIVGAILTAIWYWYVFQYIKVGA